MSPLPHGSAPSSLRARLFTIIFESSSPAGRAFDVILMVAILLSVAAVVLESIPEVRAGYDSFLTSAEWGFTVLFTVEYVLRVVAARHRLRYVLSFFGIVDLLAILPSYIGVLIPETLSLLVVRVLRLLRAFRVLKLGNFLMQGEILIRALKASRPKIIVFLTAVLCIIVVMGALMYVVEHEAPGFESIPRSMYWAVLTITMVGGEPMPHTSLGKLIASIVVVLGYGIIAVPTGIVSVELAEASRRVAGVRACPGCGATGHDADARHCKHCGEAL